MAKAKLIQVQHPDYLESLPGTIGSDPLQPARSMEESKAMETQKAA